LKKRSQQEQRSVSMEKTMRLMSSDPMSRRMVMRRKKMENPLDWRCMACVMMMEKPMPKRMEKMV